jgi:hypothetical protein
MIAMVICRLRLVLKTVYGSLPLLAASVPVTNLPISASTTVVWRIFETASFWEKLKLRDVGYRHAPFRKLPFRSPPGRDVQRPDVRKTRSESRLCDKQVILDGSLSFVVKRRR